MKKPDSLAELREHYAAPRLEFELGVNVSQATVLDWIERNYCKTFSTEREIEEEIKEETAAELEAKRLYREALTSKSLVAIGCPRKTSVHKEIDQHFWINADFHSAWACETLPGKPGWPNSETAYVDVLLNRLDVLRVWPTTLDLPVALLKAVVPRPVKARPRGPQATVQNAAIQKILKDLHAGAYSAEELQVMPRAQLAGLYDCRSRTTALSALGKALALYADVENNRGKTPT